MAINRNKNTYTKLVTTEAPIPDAVKYGTFPAETSKTTPYVIQTTANPLSQNIQATTGTLLTRYNTSQVFVRADNGWIELGMKSDIVNNTFDLSAINSFIGRVNESFPTYSSVNYITQHNNLTNSISELDAVAKTISDRIDNIASQTNHNLLSHLDGGDSTNNYYGHNTELMQTRQVLAGNGNGYAILDENGKIPLNNLNKYIIYAGIAGANSISIMNPAASTDIIYSVYDMNTNQMIGLSFSITTSIIECTDIRTIENNNQIKIIIN